MVDFFGNPKIGEVGNLKNACTISTIAVLFCSRDVVISSKAANHSEIVIFLRPYFCFVAIYDREGEEYNTRKGNNSSLAFEAYEPRGRPLGLIS